MKPPFPTYLNSNVKYLLLCHILNVLLSGREKQHEESAQTEQVLGASCSPVVQGAGTIKGLVTSYFDNTSPLENKVITLEDALLKHHEYVRRECRAAPEEILKEL